jgi:hypothetical protein
MIKIPRIKKDSRAKLGTPTSQAVPKKVVINQNVPTQITTTVPASAQIFQTGQTAQTVRPIVEGSAVGPSSRTDQNIIGGTANQTSQDSQPSKKNDKKYQDPQKTAPGIIPPANDLKPEGMQPGKLLEPEKPDYNSEEYKSSITLYRPEIIALTKFNPLYDESLNHTEYGKLFEALVETLRKSDVAARNLVNSSQQQQDSILKNNQKLNEELNVLNSKINELSSYIQTFVSLQDSIDLSKFSFSPQEFLSYEFQNPQSFSTYDSLNSYVSRLEKNLTLNKALHYSLSYKNKNQDKEGNYFNSPPTRSWIVSLEEMKQMIHSHSRKKMNVKTNDGISLAFLSLPDLISNDRITAQKIIDLGNEIIGETEDILEGSNRFLSIQEHISRFNRQVDGVSILLYVMLKEIRQRACLQMSNQNITLQSRNEKINSLILSYYPVNGNVYKRSNENVFSGTKLYDIGVFGEFGDRSRLVFPLEKQKPPGITNGNDYFFKDFGSESFFTQILSQEGSSDKIRIDDFTSTLNEVDKLFSDYLLNSGILPIDDSKVSNVRFSTDPVRFLQDVCSKLLDTKGRFLLTKNLAGTTSLSGYAGAGNYDLDALMLFGLASGNSISKSKMGSKDLPIKNESTKAGTYRLQVEPRTPEKNISILKNALYSYVLKRLSGETQIDEATKSIAYRIYYVLTNIADVVGAGLITNDDYKDLTVNEGFGEQFQEGEQQSVLVSSDPDNGFSAEERAIVGPTTTGNPFPRNASPSDEFIKWGMWSIQTQPEGSDPSSNAEPFAIQDIITTLQSSKFIDEVVELMRPVSESDISQDFSLVYFDVICNLIGGLAPIKNIRVYIDDYMMVDEGGVAGSTFGTDNEIRSALVFFTHFHRSESVAAEAAATYKQEIINNLIEETNSLISLSFSTLNVVTRFLNNFKEINNKLYSFKSEIAEYFAAYLNNDPKKFALMFNEQQLSLIVNLFQDFYNSYNFFLEQNENETPTDQLFSKQLDSLSYSTKIVKATRQFFKDSDYNMSKGYNKQILTVGIPQGLLKDLFNKSIAKSINSDEKDISKSNDIFKILVYKIDLLNDNIVYLPQEFLFETSRFVVKDYSKIEDTDLIVSNVSDFENSLFKVFSTRNFEIFSKKSNSLFQEFKAKSSPKEAFASADYTKFLDDEQMSSILKNHIVSFILENYLQIVSGIKFSESSFILSDPNDVELLYKDFIDIPVDSQGNFISLGSGRGSRQDRAGGPNSPERIAKKLSLTADVLLKNLLHPKSFDRVFNIIFDPDSFIVDESKTSVDTLVKMREIGRIRQITYKGKIYHVDNDRSFKDPTLNSYFVNIETLNSTKPIIPSNSSNPMTQSGGTNQNILDTALKVKVFDVWKN